MAMAIVRFRRKTIDDISAGSIDDVWLLMRTPARRLRKIDDAAAAPRLMISIYYYIVV